MPVLPVTKIRSGGVSLALQRLGRPRRRGEMPRRDAGGQHAVHFFREGLRHVAGAQPGLDVRYRNSAVEGRQRPRQRGRGIALDHHQVRALGLQHRVDPGQNAAP